jgi:predicted nuclease of restriction endonuclease-like (RecB) superfamily
MEDLLIQIRALVGQARSRVNRSINNELTNMYWHVGRLIVENEQLNHGKPGSSEKLLKELSAHLQGDFGSNFSERNLYLSRQLFISFPQVNTLYSQLSWSHYKVLVRLQDADKRAFFEAEASKNAWSVRQLERQINSLLYERLLKSTDKESVLAMAKGEQLPTEPMHIIKDPTVLEFLDLKMQPSYYERDLEQAILTHLQEFLLELGNGFSFVARQKRLVIDGDEFKIDLVFYNRLLQCFVLFDIKLDKITHQDLGQLQMYVNYFDRDVKQSFEQPTIGVLLCADKNDTVVQYSLPLNNKQIIASKYQFYLPTEEQLISEMKKELDRFDRKKDEG